MRWRRMRTWMRRGWTSVWIVMKREKGRMRDTRGILFAVRSQTRKVLLDSPRRNLSRTLHTITQHAIVLVSASFAASCSSTLRLVAPTRSVCQPGEPHRHGIASSSSADD